jgi:hypothetical protein
MKFSWLHNKESQRYSKINTYLNISNIAITSISATTITSTNSLKDIPIEITNVITITFSALLIVSTVINSIQQAFNYEKIAENHRTASFKYLGLANNIKRIIALDKDNKKCSMDFFKLSSNDYDNLLNNSPFISESSYKEYDKLHLTEKSVVIEMKPDIRYSIEQFTGSSTAPIENPNKKREREIQYNMERYAANEK